MSSELYDALGSSLDVTTFEQILEMDDDDDEREFSKSIVLGFFTQADGTFTSMDEALEKKDLSELSSLGHFLKGSSATLGLNKVRDSCEQIQNYGSRKDEHGEDTKMDDATLLTKCKEVIKELKEETYSCEHVLKRFYDE